MQDDILTGKLQKLIDKDEILDLISCYCHGIDKKNLSLFMSIWAADAEYDLPRGRAENSEQIRQLVNKVWREVPKCHHHTSNPMIDIQNDQAIGKSDVLYFRQTSDGRRCWLSGGYDFEFIKLSDGWKIKSLKFSSFVEDSPLFQAFIS